MPISKRLAMTEDRLIDLMMNTWNMRIATIGPGVEINLTPMWFGWAEGKIFTYGRGQKVVNVRRNPVCSIIVDRNERFPELQAAMFQGRARVLETAAEEEAEPGMDIVREQMGVKYAGGHGEPKPRSRLRIVRRLAAKPLVGLSLLRVSRLLGITLNCLERRASRAQCEIARLADRNRANVRPAANGQLLMQSC